MKPGSKRRCSGSTGCANSVVLARCPSPAMSPSEPWPASRPCKSRDSWNPHKVEDNRRRIRGELQEVDKTIESQERVRADLDVTSERSVLVAQACPAADRELFPKLAEFQAHVTDLGSRIGTLEGLLTEAFVALMRMAEEFSAAGGEPALMAARDHLNGL